LPSDIVIVVERHSVCNGPGRSPTALLALCGSPGCVWARSSSGGGGRPVRLTALGNRALVDRIFVPVPVVPRTFAPALARAFPRAASQRHHGTHPDGGVGNPRGV